MTQETKTEASPREILKILDRAARLKINTRHCETAPGRMESVADHSWRMALMAMLLSEIPEFQSLDMNRVIRMCLIHDLGEAFTGDIPTFVKTTADETSEDALFDEWVRSFPEPQRIEWKGLLIEMREMETGEAKLYKALDKLEAVLSHDESDISTWLPLEYDLQFHYGREQVQFSPYLRKFKTVLDDMTREKIRAAGEGKEQE